MASKWFNDIFLKSLFDRCPKSGQLWLTRKQTSICVDNMKKQAVIFSRFQDDNAVHLNYTCNWDGRSVLLWYSKLNGCGAISFGLTEEERQENVTNEKKRMEQVNALRIERIKNNPERRLKHIERSAQEISRAKKELDILLSFNDPEDQKEIEYYTNIINTEQAKINALSI